MALCKNLPLVIFTYNISRRNIEWSRLSVQRETQVVVMITAQGYRDEINSWPHVGRFGNTRVTKLCLESTNIKQAN